MSAHPIRTTAELAEPWVYLEVADGRVATLQLDRASLSRDRETELADAIIRVTNEALAAQADQLLAAPKGEPDGDRDLVGALVARVMDESPPPVAPRPGGSAEVAETRALVVDGMLAGLWIDAAVLDRNRLREAEDAVRDAINSAIEREEATMAVAVDGLDPDSMVDSPSWADLARSIDRIERGLL